MGANFQNFPSNYVHCYSNILLTGEVKATLLGQITVILHFWSQLHNSLIVFILTGGWGMVCRMNLGSVHSSGYMNDQIQKPLTDKLTRVSVHIIEVPSMSACMYNYTNNQHFNLPDQYSIPLRIVQAVGDEGMGGGSVFAAGCLRYKNKRLLWYQNRQQSFESFSVLGSSRRRWHNTTGALRSLHASSADLQLRHAAKWTCVIYIFYLHVWRIPS